jgi:hypothetical protein
MASGMPLSYLSRSYVEPSAPAGVDRLGAEPLLARPALGQIGGSHTRKHTRSKHKPSKHKRRHVTRGGFNPSIMGSFIKNAAMLVPVAGISGYRMIKNYKPMHKTKSKAKKTKAKTKKAKK